MAIASLPTVDLYHDSFGDVSDPTLVMLGGLGAQILNYPDEWCEAFVDRGLRVIRLDNRDAGLSTHFSDATSYTLDDMAADVVGLLDHLGIESCHLWGSSMGGMIAQIVAINAPDRLRSLISVQSTTGEAGVGEPDMEALAELIAMAAPAVDRDDAIDKAVRLAEVLVNNPEVFDAAQQRSKAEHCYDRSYDPAANARQMNAVIASKPRADGLRVLEVPTLVIHGTRDPLIGISGGRRTAELIDGSTFLEIEGMGHDLSPVFWSQYVDAVVRHVAAVEAGRPR